MKNISYKIFLCSLLFATQIVFAQDRTISGIVTEQDGFALPGVSVIIKGTNRGVQTDLDGKFNIKASSGEELLFEYIGYKTEEIKINTQQSIKVILSEDSVLEDIIIVAYGTQKQRAVVGSIGQIKSDILEKQQATSVVSALQGTVSGVNIINSSSQPGENPTIRIRGIGSINASADPLIILDGSPFLGNINSISSDQIETINVLKDASSTALYGSRGSNGVILIKTKTGKRNNKPEVSINISSGVSFEAVKPHSVLNTEDFTKYLWEGRKNNYQYVLGNDEETARQLASDGLVSHLGYNPYGTDLPVDYNGNWVVDKPLLWETDWKKELNRNQALRNEYSFNISGGGENTTYFLSANHLNQDGLIKTSNFQRTAVRLNLDSKVNDWLQLGVNTAYSNSSQNFPTQSGSLLYSAMNWLYTIPSVFPVYKRDVNGRLIKSGDYIYDYGNDGTQNVNGVRPVMAGENAVGTLFNNSITNSRNNLNWNGYAKIDLAENLYFRTNLSYEKYDYNQKNYDNSQFGQTSSVKGRVRKTKNTFETLNFINTLHYDTAIDLHNFAFDGIFETYKHKIDNFDAASTGFLPENTQIGGGTALETIDGYEIEDRLVSYLGRLSYDYNNKYFIEGSFRRDGSTRFHKEVRFGNFFSIGGSWIITAEDFLADNSTINLLKLRTSYGELGNNNTGSDFFPYLRLFDTGYNQLGNPGVLLGDLRDPNLTWEKTASFNIGLDFSLFNNTIEGSVDYYKKRSIDLLYKIPLAYSTGNLNILSNAGTVENYGLEVNLTSHNIKTADLIWDTNLNFSIDRNKIKALTQKSFINGIHKWEVGSSLYDFYIREYAGVDINDGYAMWYKDILDSDENVIGKETTKDYESATKYYNGSALPKIIGGFNTTLKYKNFDFNALLNFSLGGYIYDNDYAGLMNGISRGNQSSPDIKERWKNPGDNTDIPLLLNSSNDFSNISSRFLFKNNYLRVKAVTLGYNLPIKDSGKLNLKQARIYLQAENLLTFKSHKGIDPEQSISGTTDRRSPISSTVSLGVNINF